MHVVGEALDWAISSCLYFSILLTISFLILIILHLLEANFHSSVVKITLIIRFLAVILLKEYFAFGKLVPSPSYCPQAIVSLDPRWLAQRLTMQNSYINQGGRHLGLYGVCPPKIFTWFRNFSLQKTIADCRNNGGKYTPNLVLQRCCKT